MPVSCRPNLRYRFLARLFRRVADSTNPRPVRRFAVAALLLLRLRLTAKQKDMVVQARQGYYLNR